MVLAVEVGYGASPSPAGLPIAVQRGTPRRSLRNLITRISVERGVDPRLVHALVRVESAYNPRAISPRGAMGLMQIMPATARRLKVRNPFDPVENVRAGVRELGRLIQRYAGDVPRALAAYNAGENAVSRYGGIPPYRETRRYVAKIMSLYTGQPYRMGQAGVRAPVRLVRDSASGEVVITNSGGEQEQPPIHMEGGFFRHTSFHSRLSGGFGR